MAQPEFLTTSELAALLRIKERKVYDLAASGAVPCTKAMGKLLFPRKAVDAWLQQHATGFDSAVAGERKPVIVGSHDPLLDWALRESRCGLATFFDGSFDGLERFARNEAIAAAIHIHETDGGWNRLSVAESFPGQPVVLIEFAWRDRGLIVKPGSKISSIADLRGRQVVPRQSEAGSQQLFLRLLRDNGLAEHDVAMLPPARSEADAALAVVEEGAEAAFGLAAMARQHKLTFVPIIKERFDLLVDRQAYFEEPLQRFWTFCRSSAFAAKAADRGGYDVSRFGQVHFNGA